MPWGERLEVETRKPTAAPGRNPSAGLVLLARRHLWALAAVAGVIGTATASHAQDAAPVVVAPPMSAEEEAEHLRRGLAYLEAGDYANARLEFETVLNLDNLPPSLHQQAEQYAEAARQYLAGQRLRTSAYALLGFGSYSENETIAGEGEIDDLFLSLRVGGRANYQLSTANTLNLSLDYRFRHYDDSDRRRDSDLRWNANLSHAAGDNSLIYGARGRLSYRGNGQIRQDYGMYTEFRFLGNPDDQFTFGAEFRRRAYPEGPLRPRSRNIVEFTGSWTHVLFGGNASFVFDVGGGLENATDDRPDGDTAFVHMSPSFNFTLSERWSGFVFVFWQNDAYSLERVNSDTADLVPVGLRRNDDLWEVGGGLTFEFGRDWSLNPEFLWLRDDSNILNVNYSSTELWVTLRKDF
jgi:hypothetical protein